MSDDHLSDVTADLRVTVTSSDPLHGSQSGARVHPVTRDNGRPAVLKVTTATDGAAREAAERELQLYLHLRPHIGVRTPQLLDYRESVDTIALLLSAHPAPRPAVHWSRNNWLHLADDLARLHSTPMPAGTAWHRPSWVAQAFTNPDLVRAEEFWSWPDERDLIDRILTDTESLQAAMDPLTDGFLHGDCHTDNILIEGNQLVWADWQGAGAGNPAGELAFPSVRATPSGATLPQQDIIGRYAATRGLDSAQVTRATLAAELAIFLLTWPEYAAYNDDAGIRNVHQRVQHLARQWLDT